MKLASKIRAFILLLMAVFIIFSVYFLHSFAEYISFFFADIGITLSNYVIYVLGAILIAVCISILAISMRFVGAVERDEIFTNKTANTLSLISRIFFVTCGAFFLVPASLFIIGERYISPMLAILDLVGIAIGVLLFILSDYIRRASELKEEVDLTL